MLPVARIFRSIMVTAAVGLSAMTVSAVSFSDMSNEEISALLADVSATAAAEGDRRSGAYRQGDSSGSYRRGSCDQSVWCDRPSVSKHECSDQVFRILRLRPEEDNAALWLETSGGYGISYYGCSRKCPPWPGSVTRH